MTTANPSLLCNRKAENTRTPSRIPRLISVFVLALALVFASSSVAPSAHAGTKNQGTKNQGTKNQGTKNQGTKNQGTKNQGTKNQGTKNQGTKNQGTKNQGTKNQGTKNQGTKNQGTKNQGTKNQGTKNQGTKNQGTKNQGTKNQGTKNQGTKNQGTKNQGTKNQGTKNQGTKNQGTKNQGTKNQGTKNQGTKNQGTKNQGTKNQGTKNQGTKNQGTESQGTKAKIERLDGTPIGAMQMHGSRFVGVLADPARGDITLIHVLRFRGADVDAMVWTRDAGWSSRALHARDLVGVEWAETVCDDAGACADVRYRITGAEADRSENTMPGRESNSDVWLYDVESTTAEYPSAADWDTVCMTDAEGSSRGLFVTGDSFQDGSRSTEGYTFSCTAGVIAKCVRSWGYKPWKSLTSRDGRVIDLAPLHQACTRAARADYCGDGVSFTRDGTLVDMFDIHGFNVREDNDGFSMEAAFSPDGAEWVARTRWPVAGASSSEDVVELPQCRRRRTSHGDAAERAVIHVWSQTER